MFLSDQKFSASTKSPLSWDGGLVSIPRLFFFGFLDIKDLVTLYAYHKFIPFAKVFSALCTTPCHLKALVWSNYQSTLFEITSFKWVKPTLKGLIGCINFECYKSRRGTKITISILCIVKWNCFCTCEKDRFNKILIV